MNHLFSAIYQLVWLGARPLLHRAPRLRRGWQQRNLLDTALPLCDIWVQSASGGESLLTNEILRELAVIIPAGTTLRVLATSGTPQGIATLEKGRSERGEKSSITTIVRYCPFDMPTLMSRAMARFQPGLIVLLETELWPGLLAAARRNTIPVLVVNARMSPKSFRYYHHLRRLISPLAPERVVAISTADATRFNRVMATSRVSQMNNIKFDRLFSSQPPEPQPACRELLVPGTPFVLLGSIRREEEEILLPAITDLFVHRPDIVIGLFPKHTERAAQWMKILEKESHRCVLRSSQTGPVDRGTVIVWDIYGELAGAYGLAHAAFVGGSLANLGGHNFLEPLLFGLQPAIGPHWWSFSWVSREIVDVGLVREVADGRQLVQVLLEQLSHPEPREKVKESVRTFLAEKRGGAAHAAGEIWTAWQKCARSRG